MGANVTSLSKSNSKKHLPSKTIIPHSCSWSQRIVCSASHERFWVCVIIEYVVTNIPQPIGLSFASLVKRQIIESSAVDHILNCCFHCSTDTPELHSTRARLRTVQQAVTPTKLLPAPVFKIVYRIVYRNTATAAVSSVHVIFDDHTYIYTAG